MATPLPSDHIMSASSEGGPPEARGVLRGGRLLCKVEPAPAALLVVQCSKFTAKELNSYPKTYGNRPIFPTALHQNGNLLPSCVKNVQQRPDPGRFRPPPQPAGLG